MALAGSSRFATRHTGNSAAANEKRPGRQTPFPAVILASVPTTVQQRPEGFVRPAAANGSQARFMLAGHRAAAITHTAAVKPVSKEQY